MSAPLFSIILPSFNRAGMLRAAVRSVAAQTCRDFELLVMDDGSTDDTPSVAAEFGSDPRIVWTRSAENRGQHVRRNEAIRRAKARFITFLDSDDLYLPERLELFKTAIEKRPSTAFWFSNAYVHRFGRIIGRVFPPCRAIPEGKVPGYYAVGDEHLPYLTTNVAIAAEQFKKVGLFREDLKILEDTELYARMLAAGAEVGVIRQPTSIRRIHEAQITRDYAKDFEESSIALDSGSVPPEIRETLKKKLAIETGTYFLKDLQPAKARAYFERAGYRGANYWATYLPPRFLELPKKLRRAYLEWGGSPLRRDEFDRVETLVRELTTDALRSR